MFGFNQMLRPRDAKCSLTYTQVVWFPFKARVWFPHWVCTALAQRQTKRNTSGGPNPYFDTWGVFFKVTPPALLVGLEGKPGNHFETPQNPSTPESRCGPPGSAWTAPRCWPGGPKPERSCFSTSRFVRPFGLLVCGKKQGQKDMEAKRTPLSFGARFEPPWRPWRF